MAVARHKLIDNWRRDKIATVFLDAEGAPVIADEQNIELLSITLDLKKLLDMWKPPIGDIIYAMKVEGMIIGKL